MFRGGDFKIWCEIVFENIEDYSVKTVKSEEVSLNVLYPDQATIEKCVKNDMEDLWKKSISDTNLAEMREFGFYITMSRGGDGVLTMQPVKICEGEKNICPRKGEEVVNTVKLEGDEYDASTIEPFREVEYLIAQFHTHPPLTNCSPETKRKGGVGPSEIDKDNINARDPYIPAFVYDYENNITGGHSPDAPAKIYDYGADRRIDYY